MKTTTPFCQATVAGPTVDFERFEPGCPPDFIRAKPKTSDQQSIFELVNRRIRRSIGAPTPPPPPSWGAKAVALCRNPLFQGVTLGMIGVAAVISTPATAVAALIPVAPWILGVLFVPGLLNWVSQNKSPFIGGVIGAGIGAGTALLLAGASATASSILVMAGAGALVGFYGCRYYKQVVAFVAAGSTYAHFAGAGSWAGATAAATSNPDAALATLIFLAGHVGHLAVGACAIGAFLLVSECQGRAFSNAGGDEDSARMWNLNGQLQS